MATRTFLFFMTVDEVWEALRVIAEKHHIKLHLRSIIGPDTQVHEWSPTAPARHALSFPAHVFLSEDTQPITPGMLLNLSSAQAGVVRMWFPGLAGNRLYMNDLGAKSDWFEHGQTHENPSVLDLHRKVKATLKKLLKSGMVGTNIKYGGSSLFKDVWSAPGAIRFHAAGGELMQWGVENVRYAPPTE